MLWTSWNYDIYIQSLFYVYLFDWLSEDGGIKLMLTGVGLVVWGEREGERGREGETTAQNHTCSHTDPALVGLLPLTLLFCLAFPPVLPYLHLGFFSPFLSLYFLEGGNDSKKKRLRLLYFWNLIVNEIVVYFLSEPLLFSVFMAEGTTYLLRNQSTSVRVPG